MSILNLQPSIIWFYFNEISQIPRPSKKEDGVIKYLELFANKHKLKFKRDNIGNVLISKNASDNRHCKCVILQSHMDMVCEKNASSNHCFDTDPIQTYVEDGWVKAKGTTLGADDGIGMAAQLAILASSDIEHGPLECLFTVDEETGLSGAFALEEGFMSGEILLNLDSEDDGELFIGCAGGIDTLAQYKCKEEKAPTSTFAFKISVSNLLGGHSGDDINKGHANAIRLLTSFLCDYIKYNPVNLISIKGGNLRNAIPREAEIEALIPFSLKENLRVEFNEYVSKIEDTYKDSDPSIRFSLQSIKNSHKCFSLQSTCQVLNALSVIPNGVIQMDKDIPNFVETSTNLASVFTSEDDGHYCIEVSTSQRSSKELKKIEVANGIKSIFDQNGFEVTQTDGYPGWKPNINSPIAKLVADSYSELFLDKPKIKAIHAGLECGLFLEKFPQLDMVSFGPTIRGAHSPDERLEIVTVHKFWTLLITVLKII